MVPKFGTSFRLFFGILLTVLGGAGCAAENIEVRSSQVTQVSAGEQLFSQAKFFDSRGESVRAEQYFLAAIREGIPRQQVFPLLLQSCIESGRLRSALNHLEEELRFRADDPRLLQLAASLSWALDQPRASFRYVDRLEQVMSKRLPTYLFLAEFYDKRAGDPERSLVHYQEALQLARRGGETSWIQANLLRLTRQIDEERVAVATRGVSHD